MQLHLVDEPRSKELLVDNRATRQSDVIAAGSPSRLHEHRRDLVREESVSGWSYGHRVSLVWSGRRDQLKPNSGGRITATVAAHRAKTGR